MREKLDKKILILGIIGSLLVIGLVPLASGYYADKCAVAYLDGISTANDPYIEITRPNDEHNYINDVESPKIDGVEPPLVFGRVTIQADASQDIDEVIFYINDMDTYVDNNAPYEWLWDFKLAIGTNIIKVEGYDDGELVAEDSLAVFSVMIENV